MMATRVLRMTALCRPSLTTHLARRGKSMLAWKVNDCLGEGPSDVSIESKLRCVKTKLPTMSMPNDVLVKVNSTSVNPLDLRMMYGYGRRVLDLMDVATNFEPRITNDRFPLTLGRDFSGEVLALGPCVKNLKVGDPVFGVVEPHKSGAHAEYVVVRSYCLTKKPSGISHQQAASMPFVGLTAYSALSTFGSLSSKNCSGKRVLVIGGSGGVGSFAVQQLKLWGADVTATSSQDKLDWLRNDLLVDDAIDHDDLSQLDSLRGRFDFVLDAGSHDLLTQTREDVIRNGLDYLRPNAQSVYVTLSPPILANTDKNGILFGAAETVLDAINDTLQGLRQKKSARWAVFLPNKMALESLAKLLADEVIVPHVSSVVNFHDMPQAFIELQGGNTRGKIVVDIQSSLDRPPAIGAND